MRAGGVFLREAAQFAHVLPALGAFVAAIVEIFFVADVGSDAVEKFSGGQCRSRGVPVGKHARRNLRAR